MTSFYAMLHRMRYIERWGLMRNTAKENLKEHTMDVVVIAHALALIRKRYFPEETALDPEHVALLAVFHDATEIITGDMPTPIKYFTRELRAEYQRVEDRAADVLLHYLPEELREDYRALLEAPNDSTVEREERRVIKAADTLSAYIKCLDERNMGNREFLSAEATTLAKLKAYAMPEVDWFLDHAIPAYERTLDDLGEQLEK